MTNKFQAFASIARPRRISRVRRVDPSGWISVDLGGFVGKKKEREVLEMADSNGARSEELEALSRDRQPRVVSGLNRPLETKPLGEQTRAVRRQGLMVILGNLGVLSAGMGLGLPTVTQSQLTDPAEAAYLTAAQFTWFASLNMLACPLGGLLSGLLLDKLGRKKTLYVLNVLGLISWALMAFASHEDAPLMYIELLASRFIIGVASGLASAPVGVYSAEISTPKMRGRLILGTSISVASGITLIYLMGYFIRDDWRLIALISFAYQFVCLLCVVPLPESPSWLVAKGRLAKAKRSLNYFRGLRKNAELLHPEVVAEFNALQKNVQLGEGEKRPPFCRAVRLPEVYKPLLILMGLFAFQQLTGIFVVIVYAVQISTEAGVSIDPFLCAVLIGVARLVTTCPMGLILEKWGRRGAGLVSAAGMAVCMFLLAAHRVAFLQSVPYLPVAAIIAFIVLSTVGLFTLPFFMISELFPQKVRGPASGLTVAFGMFVSFVCIKTYPAMKAAIGDELCFVIYGVLSLAAMIFVYLFLPETRGRTLLEIEQRFRNDGAPKPPEVEMAEICVR